MKRAAATLATLAPVLDLAGCARMPAGSRVRLPTDGARATVHADITAHVEILYVLTDSPDPEGTTIRVVASPDGVHWVEVMHFRSRTFARSFALLNGDFYFGLGCEVANPEKWTMQEFPPETGQILRVKRAYWKQD